MGDSADIYERWGRSVNIRIRLGLINLVSPQQQNTDNTKVLPQAQPEVPSQGSFNQLPGEKGLQVLLKHIVSFNPQIKWYVSSFPTFTDKGEGGEGSKIN